MWRDGGMRGGMSVEGWWDECGGMVGEWRDGGMSVEGWWDECGMVGEWRDGGRVVG